MRFIRAPLQRLGTLQFSESLKKNYEFKRLYLRGKKEADPFLAVYCRKNKTAVNRVGITVGKKIGNAVQRNRLRRRIKEAYRINENIFLPGYDIVIVGRVKASFSGFDELCQSMKNLFSKMGIKNNRKSPDGK